MKQLISPFFTATKDKLSIANPIPNSNKCRLPRGRWVLIVPVEQMFLLILEL